MASCRFTRLPQEIRDTIFEYALSKGELVIYKQDNMTERRTKRLPPMSDDNRWEWNVHYPIRAPITPALSLRLSSRQLNLEMAKWIETKTGHDDSGAELTLRMGYPNITPEWTHFTIPPKQVSNLHVILKVDQMYHPAYIGRGPLSATLTATFEILKRYIHYGPHLDKPSALHRPLHLKTARVTIAPPVPFSEMTHIYGFPTQQLETIFEDFKRLMERLGRSGLPGHSIDAFEIRMEGRDWQRIPVTSNIWDENDFVFFQNAGFKWSIE